jgi:hypothetical protein
MKRIFGLSLTIVIAFCTFWVVRVGTFISITLLISGHSILVRPEIQNASTSTATSTSSFLSASYKMVCPLAGESLGLEFRVRV